MPEWTLLAARTITRSSRNCSSGLTGNIAPPAQVRCLALCTKEEVNSIWAKAVDTAAGQSVQITANLVKGIKNQICKVSKAMDIEFWIQPGAELWRQGLINSLSHAVLDSRFE